LKKELDKIQEDYVKWEKDQKEEPTPLASRARDALGDLIRDGIVMA
jgi:hypothetical protein